MNRLYQTPYEQIANTIDEIDFLRGKLKIAERCNQEEDAQKFAVQIYALKRDVVAIMYNTLKKNPKKFDMYFNEEGGYEDLKREIKILRNAELYVAPEEQVAHDRLLKIKEQQFEDLEEELFADFERSFRMNIPVDTKFGPLGDETSLHMFMREFE